jgi:hypothetical protein
MKKFLVKINAYQYHAEFEIFAEDNIESVENSIVDKVGEKGVKWEYLGEMMDPRVKRITYEEVSDAITSERSVQTEKSTGSRMGAGAS